MSSASMLFLVACCAVLPLCSCTVMVPNEPDVLVLPGKGKSFEQFRADNELCKQFAYDQVNHRSPGDVAVASGLRSAALGTVLGAALGAATNGGRGASSGAGAGLALGGIAGTETAESSAAALQRSYDIGFQQCMYAKGNRVPAGQSLMDDFFLGRHWISRPQANR